MSLFAAMRLALSALLLNKTQSALTSLGIVIGISAVIALVSAGSGARKKLDDRLENAGKNLIIVRPGARTGAGMAIDVTPLTAADADAIAQQGGTMLLGAVPWQDAPRIATTHFAHAPTVLAGTTAPFQRVCNWKLACGRNFDEDEVKQAAPVCVLGETIRRKLFPDRSNPVGERVQVDRLQLRVIGVMAEKGHTPLGVDQDDQIFLPLTTLQKKLVGHDDVQMILAAAPGEGQVDSAKSVVERAMRVQHHLKAGAPEDFDVSSVHELAEFAVVLTATLQLLVGVIAGIALLVGGIGIMNIMLVAVTQRTREIGIRLAVGAQPSDVLTQFLMEAVVLATMGGLVGVVLGIVGAAVLARMAEWPLVVSPWNVALALGVTAAVGVFFGWWPALKASRAQPIEALRYE